MTSLRHETTLLIIEVNQHCCRIIDKSNINSQIYLDLNDIKIINNLLSKIKSLIKN